MTMKTVLINLLVLFAFLVLTEVAFRILGFGYGNATLDDDPALHHVHPANYRFLSYSPSKEYGGHQVFFDEKGFRVDENGGKTAQPAPIWFLGDSFTEAMQVSWAASFPGKAEALLGNGFSAVNMGVSSYSPILELLQLKKQFADGAPKPAMAFIQLYSNDAKDDEDYAKSATFGPDGSPVKCDGGRPSAVSSFLRNFYLVRVLRKAQLTMRYIKEHPKDAPKTGTDLRTGDYVEQAPVIADSMRFAKSIFQIHQLLEEKGIPHRFFAIPSKYACLTGDWAAPSFSANFNKFATEKGLPFIDLNEVFKASASPSNKLFYDLDIHINEKGHDLIAQEIVKSINLQLKKQQ